MRLVTPEQMREMDRRAIQDVGLPGVVLMEHAALGALEVLVEGFGVGAGSRVGILCGGGNNGGDGFALARLLAGRGARPVVAMLVGPEDLGGDAATNERIAERLGLPMLDLSQADDDEIEGRLGALGAFDLWCDAIVGTGLDRPLEGRFARAVDFLNHQPAPVVALDVPSGIDARTGAVVGVAVEADATVSFALPKMGQMLVPARKFGGRVVTVDIGLPEEVVAGVGWEAELLDARWAQGALSPRPLDFHKGRAGRILVLGGSREHAGAVLMAARGALVGGGGLITVGTREEVVPLVAAAVPEAMAARMLASTEDGGAEDRLRNFVEGVDTVAAGPGLGLDDGAQRAVGILLDSDELAHVVFDADALNVLAHAFSADAAAGVDTTLERLRALAHRTAVVLTPHPGEAARLFHTSTEAITADPVAHARALATRTGCIVVLKIATTVVAGPDGRLAVNATGNPGMATGGMGDALTGIVAALLSDHDDPFTAAALAVHVHGAAGDRAARTCGQRGLTVGALLDALPSVLAQIEEGG